MKRARLDKDPRGPSTRSAVLRYVHEPPFFFNNTLFMVSLLDKYPKGTALIPAGGARGRLLATPRDGCRRCRVK